MARIFVIAVNIAFLALWGSPLLAQQPDLAEARHAVLDLSGQQISALESVAAKVPFEAQAGVAEAIRAQETGRNQALEALSSAQRGHISKEVGVARAYDAVEQGTRKHLEVLSGLLDKVPDEARPAIKRALQESQTGRNTALSTLSAVRQGGIPSLPSAAAGRETSVGPPNMGLRPEGRGIFTGSGREASPSIGGNPGGFGRPSSPGGVGGAFGGGRPGGFPGGGRPGR